MDVVMRYKHDCDKCKPLGTYAEYDLYFCEQGGDLDTVIARHGDDGPQYLSGLGSNVFPLEMAMAMAIDLGYMDDSL